jgi:hypothetical protein
MCDLSVLSVWSPRPNTTHSIHCCKLSNGAASVRDACGEGWGRWAGGFVHGVIGWCKVGMVDGRRAAICGGVHVGAVCNVDVGNGRDWVLADWIRCMAAQRWTVRLEGLGLGWRACMGGCCARLGWGATVGWLRGGGDDGKVHAMGGGPGVRNMRRYANRVPASMPSSESRSCGPAS